MPDKAKTVISAGPFWCAVQHYSKLETRTETKVQFSSGLKTPEYSVKAQFDKHYNLIDRMRKVEETVLKNLTHFETEAETISNKIIC